MNSLIMESVSKAVKPYSYSALSKLQKENVPYYMKPELTLVSSFIYNGETYNASATEYLFKINNLPATERLGGASPFWDKIKNVSDKINLFIIYAFGSVLVSPEDYIIYNGKYAYIKTGSKRVSNSILDPTICQNGIYAIVYPEFFSYTGAMSTTRSYIPEVIANNYNFYSECIGTEGNTSVSGNITSCTINLKDTGIDSSIIVKENFIIIPIKANNKTYYAQEGISNIRNSIKRKSYYTWEIDFSRFSNSSNIAYVLVFVYQYAKKGIDYETIYDKIYKLTNYDDSKMDILNNSELENRYNSEERALFESGLDMSVSGLATEEAIFRRRFERIANFDPGLLNDFYNSKSSINVVEITGADLLASNGAIPINYGISNNGSRSVVVVFKNGLLYENYSNSVFYTDTVVIDTSGISNTDKIDLLYLSNLRYIADGETVMTQGDIISGDIAKDYEFFSSEADETEFDLASMAEDTIYFPVRLTTDTNGDVQNEVSFENTYYSGKTIIKSYKNKFRYVSCIITAECVGISLPNTFKYCTDESRYMVFVNGKKMRSSDIVFVFPEKTKPFYESAVFMQHILRVDDRVEIFYMPVSMDTYTIDIVTKDFKIEVPYNRLKIPMSKDHFVVFADGKKIQNADLSNVKNNMMQILNAPDNYSYYNIEVFVDSALNGLDINNMLNLSSSTMEQAIDSIISKDRSLLLDYEDPEIPSNAYEKLLIKNWDIDNKVCTSFGDGHVSPVIDKVFYYGHACDVLSRNKYVIAKTVISQSTGKAKTVLCVMDKYNVLSENDSLFDWYDYSGSNIYFNGYCSFYPSVYKVYDNLFIVFSVQTRESSFSYGGELDYYEFKLVTIDYNTNQIEEVQNASISGLSFTSDNGNTYSLSDNVLPFYNIVDIKVISNSQYIDIVCLNNNYNNGVKMINIISIDYDLLVNGNKILDSSIKSYTINGSMASIANMYDVTKDGSTYDILIGISSDSAPSSCRRIIIGDSSSESIICTHAVSINRASYNNKVCPPTIYKLMDNIYVASCSLDNGVDIRVLRYNESSGEYTQLSNLTVTNPYYSYSTERANDYYDMQAILSTGNDLLNVINKTCLHAEKINSHLLLISSVLGTLCLVEISHNDYSMSIVKFNHYNMTGMYTNTDLGKVTRLGFFNIFPLDGDMGFAVNRYEYAADNMYANYMFTEVTVDAIKYLSTDIEPQDDDPDYIPDRSSVYKEIIALYYGIFNRGEPFYYNFHDSAIIGTDNSGNYLVGTLDASIDDKVDIDRSGINN